MLKSQDYSKHVSVTYMSLVQALDEDALLMEETLQTHQPSPAAGQIGRIHPCGKEKNILVINYSSVNVKTTFVFFLPSSNLLSKAF